MINWEQKKIHRFTAIAVFITAVLFCLLELSDCLAAKKNQTESFKEILNQPKKEKEDERVFNLTKMSLPAKRDAYSKDQLIIKYKKGTAEKVEESTQVAGSRNYQRSKIKSNLNLVSLENKIDVSKEIKSLRKNPDVDFVQPNFQYSENQINTNDTLRENLWGLENTGQEVNGKRGIPDADIDAPEGWRTSDSGQDIIVAVIDTGVAFNHPDLEKNMWDGSNCVDWQGGALGGCQHGYDFAVNDKNPLPDRSAHGTLVAGVIGAIRDNGRGIAGVSNHVKIMAIKTNFTTVELIKSIEFARRNGATIINASWGASVDSCKTYFDQSLYEAIKNFSGLFVAAAGNSAKNHDGQSHFFYPADFSRSTSCWEGLSNVVSIAATEQNDKLASFSDYGNLIDVGAPGENIYTSYVSFGYPGQDEDGSEDLYAVANGTSLAAPYVSGIASLLLSDSANMSAREAKSIIFNFSESVPGLSEKLSGGRRANAYQCLARSAGGSGNPTSAKTFGDLRILGDSPEISYSKVSEIQIENPETASQFRLTDNKKKIKKAKWKPMMSSFLVRTKKKKQTYYLQFRDGEGNLSPLYGKVFLYRKK